MSLRVAQLLRILTVLAFGVCVFLAIRLINPPDGVDTPKIRTGAAVRDVIGQPPRQITVTGYVFEGGGWEDIRLCDQRESGSPPQCLAPFLYVQGVDRGSFEMKSKKTKHGTARWSPGQVTVTGHLNGVELQVTTVLGTTE